MERAQRRTLARMILYVGVAAFALAIVWSVQVFQGTAPEGTSLRAVVAAVVGLLLVMPAGFAFAMAKE